MATGTNIVGAAPFPYGNDVVIVLGPFSRTGDTAGYETQVIHPVKFPFKIIKFQFCACTVAKTTDTNMKIIDDKATPQTPVAIIDVDTLTDEAVNDLTLATVTDSYVGENIKVQVDLSNAADSILNAVVYMTVRPLQASPKATETG